MSATFHSWMQTQCQLHHHSSMPRPTYHRGLTILAQSSPSGGGNMPWHAPPTRRPSDADKKLPPLRRPQPPPKQQGTIDKREPALLVPPPLEQQAKSGRPKARDLIGYEALTVASTGPGRTKSKIIGTVEEVLAGSESGASHPLLKVVKHIDLSTSTNTTTTINTSYSSTEVGSVGNVTREEHLIPLVRNIVPRIDTVERRVYIDPPAGLLDLGKRRVLLQRIKDALLPIVATDPTSSFNESSVKGSPLMPTKQQLLDQGHGKLVRLIEQAGGFLEVAQLVGLRPRRRPPGFWEDPNTLDRELTLFVAANWVKFEEEAAMILPPWELGDSSGSGGSSSSEEEEGVSLKELFALKAGALLTSNINLRRSSVDTEDTESLSPLERNENPQQQFDGSDDEEEESSPKKKKKKSGKSSSSAPVMYWYNQVTRRMRWTEPSPPQSIPLDDEGSELLAESEDDRAMPSKASLLTAGRYDLHAAVIAAGGYTAVAEELERWPAWPPTGHLRSWRTLSAELRSFVKEHRLPKGRMPTASDLLTTGRSDLYQAIIHEGGFSAVAERMKWKTQRNARGQEKWRDVGWVATELREFAKENNLRCPINAATTTMPTDIDTTTSTESYLNPSTTSSQYNANTKIVSATGIGTDGSDPLRDDGGGLGLVLCMPTHEQLRGAGRHDLRHALQRHGSQVLYEASGLAMPRRRGRPVGKLESRNNAGGKAEEVEVVYGVLAPTGATTKEGEQSQEA